MMAGLLAASGETVHVIAHRWDGAPRRVEESVGGRLIVHRLALDEAISDPWIVAGDTHGEGVRRGLLASRFPSQAFSWQAALLAERLIRDEGIDVIEAQEWEAPLYYLQVRRALGIGPAARPPCVVHLHSPSELIFAANGWDTTVADYRPAVALEEYSITAADAVLCPSRFLAAQAIARYGMDAAKVRVIPYPLGDAPHLERGAQTWSSGSICHVGRLEPRKGVLEWAEALALVAADHPGLMVEFVGADIPLDATGGATVGEAMRARIPPRLHGQLGFHGSRDRRGVQEVLSRSWAAVVPSRWENFPYSCIEAMCSGLPVIASPNGGMREMAQDGASGWIAADATPAGLAEALRRALATSGDERARMGSAAETAVRTICANDTIVRRHVELKTALARSGAPPAVTAASGHIGVIVRREGPGDAVAMAEAMRLTRGEDPPAGIAFLDPRASLDPRALAICAEALAQNGRLGIVSAWTRETSPSDRVHIQPNPAVPYLWHADELAPYMVVSTAAFGQATASGSGTHATSLLSVLDSITRSGWAALTWPAPLCSIALPAHESAARPGIVRYSAMARAVQRLHTPLLRWLAAGTPEDRRAYLRQAVRNPLRTAGLLIRHALRAWRATEPPVDLRESTRATPRQRTATGSGAPLVSVIVPAYNAERFIEETCLSALRQTYAPLEVIVVDDGSTDRTAEIVAALAAADPRLKLIHQRNQGVAAARNCAIAASTGEFIAPLDADDLWDPTKIERQVRRLQECGQEIGMVYCWWCWIDSAGGVLDSSPPWRVEGRALQRMIEVNVTGNASVPLIRRSLIERVGGYDSGLRAAGCEGCEDYDVVLRVAEHAGIAVVPAILVAYRRLSDGMSANSLKMWRSRNMVMASLAARCPSVPAQVFRRSASQFALYLAGVSYWSRDYPQAMRWGLRVLPPTIILSVLPYVIRIFARKLRRIPPPAVRLTAGSRPYEEYDLPRPLIPYDRIIARRWRSLGPETPPAPSGKMP